MDYALMGRTLVGSARHSKKEKNHKVVASEVKTTE